MTVLFSIFKLLLKIAAAPVIAILALFVWFCTWLVCVSGAVLDWSACFLCVCSGVPVPQFFCGRRHHLPGSGLFGKSFWAACCCPMAAG